VSPSSTWRIGQKRISITHALSSRNCRQTRSAVASSSSASVCRNYREESQEVYQ
jgi:hypothetical protein